MGQSVVVALAAHVECAERTAATTCPMPCTRYPTQQQVLQALTLPTAVDFQLVKRNDAWRLAAAPTCLQQATT